MNAGKTNKKHSHFEVLLVLFIVELSSNDGIIRTVFSFEMSYLFSNFTASIFP